MRNILHYCPLLMLMLTFFRSGAQDMMVLNSGDVKNVKVMEVSAHFIRYRASDSTDSTFYSVATDSVYSIKYKNGSKDFFNKGGNNAGANSSASDQPGLVSNYEMKKRGTGDAKKYYRCGGCVTGAVLGTLCGDVVGGLVVAAACASTPPKERNLGCPDQSLMKNSAYSNAYMNEAYKIKKKNTWTAFGVSAGIMVAIYALIFYTLLNL